MFSHIQSHVYPSSDFANNIEVPNNYKLLEGSDYHMLQLYFEVSQWFTLRMSHICVVTYVTWTTILFVSSATISPRPSASGVETDRKTKLTRV